MTTSDDSSITFNFDYFGAVYTAHSLGASITPPLNQVISAHVVPITGDGKIIAVRVASRGVDAPGGHVEKNEHSPLETLIREIDEEAQITLKRPILIDVLEISSSKADLGDKKYMLIYAARVDKVKPFVLTNEISERLIMQPKEFVNRYFASKEYAGHMIQKSLDVLGEHQR